MGVSDLLFFISNSFKIPEGGWLPLFIAFCVFVGMDTWRRGRRVHLEKVRSESLPLSLFLERADKSTVRVAGLGVFLSSRTDVVPGALLHNLKHNKVLHERNVLLTVETLDTPTAEPDETVEVEGLGNDFYKVTLRFGFTEDADVPARLAGIESCGLPFDMMDTTFFLSRESIVATDRPGMALWRDKIFAFMSRNALPATAFFRIPGNRLIELGTQVEI